MDVPAWDQSVLASLSCCSLGDPRTKLPRRVGAKESRSQRDATSQVTLVHRVARNPGAMRSESGRIEIGASWYQGAKENRAPSQSWWPKRQGTLRTAP